MNSSTKKYVIPMFIVVFIAILGLSSSLSISTNTDINNAQLDLQDWNSSEFLILNGEWEYFPNMLKSDITGSSEMITIPHYWDESTEYANKPFGFSTYRLQLINLDPETLMLSM